MIPVYFAAAWTAGIASARAFHLPWQALPLLALASVLVLLLWRDDRPVRLCALCALAFALGAGRLLLALPRFDDRSLATYNGAGWVTLVGVVTGEPDERDAHVRLRVRAEHLTLPDGTEREVDGLALVWAGRYPRRRYGDRLRVEGVLKPPPVFESFSYREYLSRQGIHSTILAARVSLLAENQANPLCAHLYDLKRRAREAVSAILPEPQAALLTGILLGVECQSQYQPLG
jgi:competence protein ComEC